VTEQQFIGIGNLEVTYFFLCLFSAATMH
jgi:hypothetical protein